MTGVMLRRIFIGMFRNPEAVLNFRDSAEALHIAIKEMRKKKLGLDRWVKFVHVGA